MARVRKQCKVSVLVQDSDVTNADYESDVSTVLLYSVNLWGAVATERFITIIKTHNLAQVRVHSYLNSIFPAESLQCYLPNQCSLRPS